MSQTPVSTVRLDDREYEAVARSFLLRVLTTVVDQADQLGVIHLRPDCQLSEDDLSRVHSLAFALLATFENHGGFEQGGRTWFHNTLYTNGIPAKGAAIDYLGSTSRTALHGNVDDEILQAAATAVCARRSPKPTT